MIRKRRLFLFPPILALLPLLWTSGIAATEARALRDAHGAIHYSDRLAPSMGAPVAISSERAAVTAGRMGGRWLAQSATGTIVLELRPGGGFTYDEQAQAGLERAYMCGAWSLDSGELALRTKTRKTRSATGAIELLEMENVERYTVLAARTDMLILRRDGGTFTFYRRGA